MIFFARLCGNGWSFFVFSFATMMTKIGFPNGWMLLDGKFEVVLTSSPGMGRYAETAWVCEWGINDCRPVYITHLFISIQII